ncbi:hypothetical protein AZE42_12150 [Rhizopogon vesiculosus]|uniref:Uncharacterized protein n=1 Tax=Rhizopogon vesiculosus TaxID=180088 RepID=A0A1J8PV97_9AGAM|nr:hypothetical protein AZE42_12150 [Rhizopogon vesiculosus]
MLTIIQGKSYYSGFSFGAVVNDNISEINVLTAGALPLLVPGLKVGNDMRIKDLSSIPQSDFGMLAKGDWEAPAVPSTSDNGKAKPRKTSAHKRHHFSLSNLGLGKDTANSWKTDISQALTAKIDGYAIVNDASRNTVWGDESVSSLFAHSPVDDGNQPAQNDASLGRSMSTRSLGLRVGLLPPPSAASTITLFAHMAEFNPSAQSTPYDTKKEYPYSRKYEAPAMARSQYTPASKRSSIIYIKSSREHVHTPPDPEPQQPTEQITPTRHPAPSHSGPPGR